jgi:rSAM/selenodomain-associated transferase 1
MGKRAIVIAAKPPVPGKVKTRLSPPLNLKESAELYECFLTDTVNTIATLDKIDRFIAFYPEISREDLSLTSLDKFTLIAQKGIDLGKRLSSVFCHLFSRNYQSVTIMGSDLPNLPVEFVKQSLCDLGKKSVDVTIGPCRDGGYYLIGLKAFHGNLFDGIPWSTTAVFEKTIETIRMLGLKVSILPMWYDVDDQEDLRLLKDEISASPVEVASATRGFLCSHDLFSGVNAEFK